MNAPTDRNRLNETASPYLQQHADNPVNWQPWDEAALDAAAERDVPIFLSIGYSACHWCHVMEEESFADPEVADVLNEHYVPIKVDREERPDVDSLYMTVCNVVKGGGGWPLSVFLTPERKPFYVGTYFPKHAKQNQPGFLPLLGEVAEEWETNREELEDRANQWMSAAKGELESLPDPVAQGDDSPLLDAADDLVRAADRDNGGFGRAPKFPQTGRVAAVLRAHDREGGRDAETKYGDVAKRALDAMANGGLYDHLGGGFHRYCTDADWTVPHFEKMLYDQATLVETFVDGHRLFGDGRYADVVAETLDFVDRELGHPEGGFYATLDARSAPPDDPDGEHEEGAFYVWTPEAVREAVADYADDPPAVVDDEVLADLFCERYGVTETGNFEAEQTVLTVSASVDDLAAAFALDVPDVEAALSAAESGLLAAREDRPRPARDDKVLAGWNGLMIRAAAEAGLAIDEQYAHRAAEALHFVRETLWDGDRLARRVIHGDVSGVGYAEDYAYLASGALATYEATGDHAHLGFALDLADTLLAACYDPETGALYETPESVTDVDVRSQAVGEGPTPSPVGIAAETLLELDAVDPDAGYGEAATSMLDRYGGRVQESAAGHPTLVRAADTRVHGTLEVTIAADSLPAAWREPLGGRYLPHRLLTVRPQTEDGLEAWLADLDLEDAPPVWASRSATDGEPTAYVCRRACSPPLTATETVESWLADFRV